MTPFQTIERRDVGLTLRVRPQITEGGSVRLVIYQEVSRVDDTSNPAGIITNKRSLESSVTVDDGQIVVLGGLIEDRYTDGLDKVPLAGDLPVLGGLFRYDTRKRTKTNLMVFLKPTVVRERDRAPRRSRRTATTTCWASSSGSIRRRACSGTTRRRPQLPPLPRRRRRRRWSRRCPSR